MELKAGSAILEQNEGSIWYAYITQEIDKRNLSAVAYDALSHNYVLVLPITDDWACPQILRISSISSIFYFDDVIKEVAKEKDMDLEDLIVPFIGGIPNVKMKEWYPILCKLNEKYLYKYREELKKYFAEKIKVKLM